MTEKKCSNPVNFIRHWPGQEPDHVCLEHAMDSTKILEAMNWPLAGVIKLYVYPRNIDADWELPKCACTEGRVQEVHVGPHAT